MANSRNYVSLQGTFMVGERSATGTPTNLRSLCNVDAFELSVDIEKFEHKEKCSGKRAIDLTIVQERNVTFTMTLENVAAKNLAMALWGTDSVVAAADVTDEVVTIAELDTPFPLAHINLSTDSSKVPVIQDDGDSTTYTANTDYTIDSKNGTITALSGGSIALGDDIHVDYSTLGYANVEAMTETSLERYFRFHGINTIDDTPMIVDLYRVSVDPVSSMEILNEEIMQLEITGNVLLDSLQTEATGKSQYFRIRKLDGS